MNDDGLLQFDRRVVYNRTPKGETSMNKLMIAFVAAVSLLSVAGCKKKGGASDAIAKMEGFQKQMCDCKDKACADKVQEDMTKWGTEAAKTANKDDKPDPDMVKKSGEIMTKYTECMTKLMTASMGGDKPAGDKPADPAAAGDKPTDPAAAGDKPAGDKPADDKKDEPKKDEPKKDETK
jgi:hypothetical protein